MENHDLVQENERWDLYLHGTGKDYVCELG